MALDNLAKALQLLAGLGLLNVWLLRRGSATAYRGGSSQTLRQEFDTYGLPAGAFYVVGALKVVAGLILITSLWLPMPARLAAAMVAGLMVGALLMHARAKDPARKSVPAALMLLLCAGIVTLM